MRSIRALLANPLLVAILVVASAAAHAQPAGPYRGRSVQSVIDELRAAGLPLAYSSNLVPSTLRVQSEPTSNEPLALAREILAAHGLAIRDAGGALLVVRGEPPPAATPAAVEVNVVGGVGEGSVQADGPEGPSAPLAGGRAVLGGLAPGRHTLTVRAAGYLPQRLTVSLDPGETGSVAVTLVSVTPELDELTVTASRYAVLKNIQPSSAFFSREEIEGLAEIGDDTLRVAHRMPGIAANEFSARSHVRGGAVDEMQVIFDGMRIVEPFHLRDYQSVFSAIDQRIVGGLEIYSGGFPPAYGDALSGVTIIEQRATAELEHEIGLSLLYTSALSSGTFRDGRAEWLVSARRGNVDRLLNDELGDPKYGDGFVHVATALGARHRLALSSIGFDDDVVLRQGENPGDREEGRSGTDSAQTWLKLDSDWSDALSSRILLYRTRLTAERHGVVDDADLSGTADDVRRMESVGVKQDWEWEVSDRQRLTFGFEAERLDASYRYVSAAEQHGLLATLGPPPPPRDHTLQPEGDSYAAYASDRVRITDRLVADLGMRFDRQTYLPSGDDDQLSPRASLLYRIGAQTDLRMSYGRFFQAEGLLDLQVEDGVLAFAPAQSATHSIVGVEHRFANDLALRLETFRKWTKSARPRYENLFDPLELLPELRPGRVEVRPERAEARGFEVLVTGERPVAWWASYSYAKADDLIGGVPVPRSWDQRRALGAGVTFVVGPWTLNGAAALHSGWPATLLTVATVPGEGGVPQTVAVAGPRNAARLDSMRRLDFRASKELAPKLGTLRFFAEVTNVTGRANPCCLRYEAVPLPGGSTGLLQEQRNGLPFTANVGLLWEF